jgi:hypothetical protein
MGQSSRKSRKIRINNIFQKETIAFAHSEAPLGSGLHLVLLLLDTLFWSL